MQKLGDTLLFARLVKKGSSTGRTFISGESEVGEIQRRETTTSKPTNFQTNRNIKKYNSSNHKRNETNASLILMYTLSTTISNPKRTQKSENKILKK